MAELRASAGIDHGHLYSNQPIIVKRPVLSSGFFLRIGDFFSILVVPAFASLAPQETGGIARNLCFWPLLSCITVVLIASHGGYRANLAHARNKQTRLAINCFLATSVSMFSLFILLGHPHILARHWTTADIAVTPVILATTRSAVAKQIAAHQTTKPTSGPLVVCNDRCPDGLSSALAEQNISGPVAGVLFLAPRSSPKRLSVWPELANTEAFLRMVHSNAIQDVIFVHEQATPMFSTSNREKLLADLVAYPTRIWLALDIAGNLPEILNGNSGSCKIVPLVTDNLVSSRNQTKRCFDLVVSILLLAFFAPLLLLCASLVRASGPGPVIFRQIRTGAQGQKFTVLKFRTMQDDPHRPFAQARPNDPRITRIGRFLRRSSIDELLQLVNVVRGEMSLVGPRPHAPETQVEGIDFENAVRLYRLRHRVKPGITGLAQVRGQRGETPIISMLEQRLASDLEYIQSWSLWLDISILFKTLPAVITQTNAH